MARVIVPQIPASRFVAGRHYVVNEAGCWIWQGHLDRKGYGHVVVGSRVDGSRTTWPAHRAVYVALKGPIPGILHLDHVRCVPACVNPDHLELVSCGENTRRGALAKLTWETVREIRAAAGTHREIAARFGVSHTRIGCIKRQEAWWPEP